MRSRWLVHYILSLDRQRQTHTSAAASSLRDRETLFINKHTSRTVQTHSYNTHQRERALEWEISHLKSLLLWGFLWSPFNSKMSTIDVTLRVRTRTDASVEMTSHYRRWFGDGLGFHLRDNKKNPKQPSANNIHLTFIVIRTKNQWRTQKQIRTHSYIHY